jgi:hypothetical protein
MYQAPRIARHVVDEISRRALTFRQGRVHARRYDGRE